MRSNRKSKQSQNEVERYLFISIMKENSSWQYWNDNASNFLRLTRMTRNILFCSVSSIEMKRIFSLTRRICKYDRAMLNQKTIKKTMMIKYYNRTINAKPKNAVSKIWNLIKRWKNENNEIAMKNAFRRSIKKMFRFMISKFNNKRFEMKFAIIIDNANR